MPQPPEAPRPASPDQFTIDATRSQPAEPELRAAQRELRAASTDLQTANDQLNTASEELQVPLGSHGAGASGSVLIITSVGRATTQTPDHG